MRKGALTLLFLCLPFTSFAATHNFQRGGGSRELEQLLLQLKTELNNQGSELSQLKAQIENQSSYFESLRDDIDTQEKRWKKSAKTDSIQEELAKTQKLANEQSDAINTLVKKLADLQSELDKEKEQSAHIEKALDTVLDALGIKTKKNEKVYTVKSGDSLGKIAVEQKTTIKALKAANNLKSDTIVVGQKLKLP